MSRQKRSQSASRTTSQTSRPTTAPATLYADNSFSKSVEEQRTLVPAALPPRTLSMYTDLISPRIGGTSQQSDAVFFEDSRIDDGPMRSDDLNVREDDEVARRPDVDVSVPVISSPKETSVRRSSTQIRAVKQQPIIQQQPLPQESPKSEGTPRSIVIAVPHGGSPPPAVSSASPPLVFTPASHASFDVSNEELSVPEFPEHED
eukprot:TRINITY_DN1906_c0_g1_i8.p3 TRINITY_DN1906_c0_g1~~TRINITY_DN1906_c0_g1_i8.p3  ORF type:complete len:204 (+),score=49.71 TRINITY_DN1906_c0_g1_i8:1138-1749(+)